MGKSITSKSKSTNKLKSLESDDDNNTNELLSKNILVNLKAQIEKVNDSEIGKEYDKLVENYRLYEQEQQNDDESKKRQQDQHKKSPYRKPRDHSPRKSSKTRDKPSTRDKIVPKSTIVAVKDHKKEDLHKRDEKPRKAKEETHNRKDEKQRRDEKYVFLKFLCFIFLQFFVISGSLNFCRSQDVSES